MLVLEAAISIAILLQGIALATRLCGLLFIPRSTPRALGPLFLLLGALGFAYVAWSCCLVSALAGIVPGILLAMGLACLRPLRPDSVLLARGRSLEIEGHADARALVARPENPIATILLVHGLGNDRFFALWHAAHRLIDQGFAVVLFHQPGHGAGGQDLLEASTVRARFDALVAAARAATPGPLIAVGQSFGGAVVLDAVARGVKLEGVASVSAIARLELGVKVVREVGILLHRPGWRALRYATPLDLLPAAGPFFRDRFPVRVAPGRGYLDELRAILAEQSLVAHLQAQKPAVPVLLFHGGADGIVPVAQARELAAALGTGATYLELPGRHHFDPLFDDQVIDRIAEFARAILRRLP